MNYYKFRWEEPGDDARDDWGFCWDYWEVDGDGYFTRSMHVYDKGVVLRYDKKHAADPFGQLPEGPLLLEELEPEYRSALHEINAEEFNRMWKQGS